MRYTFRVLEPAKKDLRRLEYTLLETVDRAIQSLADDPRPHGCVKLSDPENGYRIRVRHIRILYRIDDKIKTVTVYRVKHQKEVYR